MSRLGLSSEYWATRSRSVGVSRVNSRVSRMNSRADQRCGDAVDAHF